MFRHERVEDRAKTRRALIDRVVPGITQQTILVLAGPTAIGKSWMLREIQSQLEDSGQATVWVDGASLNTCDKLAELPAEAILLIDDLHTVPHEVLLTELTPRVTQQSLIASVNERVAGEWMHDFVELVGQYRELMTVLHATQYIQVPLASESELERILHEASSETLDVATIRAITQLAWGRPGWLLPLLHLHSHGAVRSYPLPSLQSTAANHLFIPPAEWARAIAQQELERGEIESVIVLSELAPRSFDELAYLIGADLTRKLISLGLLIPHSAGFEHLGVPELYAYGLMNALEHPQLEALAVQIATQLLRNETAGVSLPLRSALFCVRHLHNIGNDLGGAVRQVLHRVAEDRVDFGFRADAISLLTELPSSDRATKVRAAAVAQGPVAALRLLEEETSACIRLPDPDSPQFETFLILEELRALLSGVLHPQRHRDQAALLQTDSAGHEHPLFSLLRWNDTEQLDQSASQLLELSGGSYPEQFQLAADYLLDLELSRLGYERSHVSRAEQRDRLLEFAVYGYAQHRQLLFSLLVAEALICWMRGELARVSESLLRVAGLLAAADYHGAWLRHLLEAFRAATVGNFSLAKREWMLFSRRIPQFLPVRLRELLRATEQRLREGEGENDLLWLAPIAQYLRGETEAIALPDASKSSLVLTSKAQELPLLVLLRTHLDAVRLENPHAMLAVAIELQELELFFVATQTFIEAGVIFLRRRLSGKAQSCQGSIRQIQALASERMAWFQESLLPSVPKPHLTARERTVAQLVAEGLSDREIAVRLECSVRTVESHLARARSKLGVTKREELVKALPALVAQGSRDEC